MHEGESGHDRHLEFGDQFVRVVGEVGRDAQPGPVEADVLAVIE